MFVCIIMGATQGCASLATRLPDVGSTALKFEQHRQETAAFAEVDQLYARLHHVTAPILAANTELCPKTRYDIGVTTHKLKSYPKDMRVAAAREYGAKDTPSIRFVRPGSPSAMAGIERGDAIVGADERPLSADDKGLQTLFEDGGREISIRKKDGTLKGYTVKSREICGYNLNLKMSSVVNAYATGKSISVTSGMMKFAKNDEELALVIGHELAHNTMNHVRKIVTNTIVSGMAKRYARPFESEADYVGLYYLVRAGYSAEDVEDMWRRMALTSPRHVARAKTHPTYPDRFLRIAAAREEIAAKQKQGKPLYPNFIDAKEFEKRVYTRAATDNAE